jgi:hypothetical protein
LPDCLLRWHACVALLTLALHPIITSAVAHADPGSPRHPDNGVIGIRVAQIPTSRSDDPRARLFIADHVNPGTTFTRSLQVSSTSPKTQHLKLYAAAARIENHRFTFAPGTTGNELSSWISLNRTRIDLRPHGTASVKATIAVPARATKGEQYAVIWAEASSVQAGPKANIALVNRVGIRTYLNIGPGGEPLSDFKIGRLHPERTPDGHDQIMATVTNTGRRAIDLGGQLLLSEGPGSLSAGPFPVARGTTLMPEDHGQVFIPVSQGLPDGPWKYSLTLQSGRVTHTVTGELTFAKELGTSGLLASFLRMPVTLAITLAMFAAAALVLLTLLRRRVRTRKGLGSEEGTQRS